MTNYDCQFGTLPFRFFCQMWIQWTFRHILGPILVIFDMLIFDDSRTFQKMGALRKSKFSQ